MFEKYTYRNGVNAGEGAESSHISGTVSTTAAALEEQLRLAKLENKALKYANKKSNCIYC